MGCLLYGVSRVQSLPIPVYKNKGVNARDVAEYMQVQDLAATH